jgi:3-oxoacyl-ACP reductase-like protein
MSIFSSIMSKIFHHPQAQKTAAAAPAAASAAAAPQTAAPQAAPAPTPMAAVDVEAVLTVMAQENPQTLDWRHSIVDLMKLLSLDSGLAARKELAGELGYTGDTNDSAAMNIWLHKAVMAKLAENGGIVPDSLR